jgi:hypothetical protein
MNVINYLMLTNYYFCLQKDVSICTTYGGCYYA